MQENARSAIPEAATARVVEAGETTAIGAEIEGRGDEMMTGHQDAIETCSTIGEEAAEVEEEDLAMIALDEMTGMSSQSKQELLVEEEAKVRLRKSVNQLQI